MKVVGGRLFYFLVMLLQFLDIKYTSGSSLRKSLHNIAHVAEHHIKRRDIATHEYHYYEEVVPKIIHRKYINDNTDVPDELVVEFVAYNKTLILDVKLNRKLFSDSYIEKHYTRTNKPIVHKPTIGTQVHKLCHYQGKLRHSLDSLVAISNCHGFRGFIQDKDETYHIEPLTTSSKHLVYRASDEKYTDYKCGTEDHADYSSMLDILHRHKRQAQTDPPPRAPFDSNDRSRYIELYLVNDYRQFDFFRKNLTKVTERAKEIMNVVNALYHSLNIYVSLVGMETWTNGDKITITADSDATLKRFLQYRKKYISPKHRNDNAQLLTGHVFSKGVVGKAQIGVPCTLRYSGGVNMDRGSLIGPTATTVAHELGHNLGMQHDPIPADAISKRCTCEDDMCIMAATASGRNPTKWSSCSKKYLTDAFHLGMDYCLRNVPHKIFMGPVCGNGFLEEDEECDCGIPEMCDNKCCNATTCKLTENAVCATGKCCDLNSCSLKEPRIPCRSATAECDLPEFCTGESEFCPKDVHVKNGKDCKSGMSYCLNGQCNTRNDQCGLLWGRTGKVSDDVCYTHYNVRGTEYGNCGYNWITDKYSACDNEQDAMCGMLHCDHQNEKLMFWRDNLALYKPISYIDRGNQFNRTRYICKSVILDVGLDMQDPGLVPNGAKCGENKICSSQKCIDVAKWTETINSCGTKGCSSHGTCNSNSNCHCDEGFAPPHCDKPGSGGSIDSGPPAQTTEDNSVMVGLLVFFLLFVPLLAAAGFVAYYFRVKIKDWWNNRKGAKYIQRFRSQVSRPVKEAANKPRSRPPSISQEVHIVAKPPDPFKISQPVLQSTTNRTPSFKFSQNIQKPQVIVRPTVYANTSDISSDDDDSKLVKPKKPMPPPSINKPKFVSSQATQKPKPPPPVRPQHPPRPNFPDVIDEENLYEDAEPIYEQIPGEGSNNTGNVYYNNSDNSPTSQKPCSKQESKKPSNSVSQARQRLENKTSDREDDLKSDKAVKEMNSGGHITQTNFSSTANKIPLKGKPNVAKKKYQPVLTHSNSDDSIGASPTRQNDDTTRQRSKIQDRIALWNKNSDDNGLVTPGKNTKSVARVPPMTSSDSTQSHDITKNQSSNIKKPGLLPKPHINRPDSVC